MIYLAELFKLTEILVCSSNSHTNGCLNGSTLDNIIEGFASFDFDSLVININKII